MSYFKDTRIEGGHKVTYMRRRRWFHRLIWLGSHIPAKLYATWFQLLLEPYKFGRPFRWRTISLEKLS